MKCDGSERLKVEVASALGSMQLLCPYSGMYGDDREASVSSAYCSSMHGLHSEFCTRLEGVVSTRSRGVPAMAKLTIQYLTITTGKNVMEDPDRKDRGEALLAPTLTSTDGNAKVDG